MRFQGSAGLACLLGCMAGCGGGSGGFPQTNSSTRDDPGSTYDTPPSTRDDPSGPCLQCDVTYDCPGSSLGEDFTLSSSDGTCTPALIALVCSGALFGGSTCNGGGGGTFTCGAIVCTPEAPVQSGGNGSSGANGVDAGVVTPGTG